MNDEEIMKKFAESFAPETKKESVSPYKATSNLNKAISNPDIVIDNKMDINIKNDNNIDNSMSTADLLKIETPPVEAKKKIKPKYKFIDKDVTNPKRKKTIKLTITGETKIALLIALVLFIAVMLIPGVYDFIKNVALN